MKDDAQSGGEPDTKAPRKNEKTVHTDPVFKRFKNFFVGLNFDLEDFKPEDSPEKKGSKSKTDQAKTEEVKTDDQQDFHFKDQMMKWGVMKFIQFEKDRIVKFTAAITGGIFILSGFIMISTAAMRVVDNVMFGERAMLSSFLILMGVLILSAIFRRRFWQNKVFKKLNLDLEDSETIDGYKSSDKKPQKSNIEGKHKK